MAVSVAPASARVTATRAAGVPDPETARPPVTSRRLNDRTRIRSSLALEPDGARPVLPRGGAERLPASWNADGPEPDHPVRLHRRPAGGAGVGPEIQRVHEERP